MDFVPSQRLRALMADVVESNAAIGEQPLPVYLVLRRYRRECVPAQCSFTNFFDVESTTLRKFIWTTATGTIECHFPESHRMQFAWLEVESASPDGSIVSVSWDGIPVIQSRKVFGRHTLVLARPTAVATNQAQIAIQSSTFRPSDYGLSDDNRDLGIAVSALVFGKRRSKYRTRGAFSPNLKTSVYKLLPRWTRRIHSQYAAASKRRKAA